MKRSNGFADWPAVLISPSKSQEGGNEPSCRANGAELELAGPIPPREAGGPLEISTSAENDVALPLAVLAAGLGRSRAERGAGVPDALAGEAGLPCQNRNNSNNRPKRYRLKAIPGQPGSFQDSSNHWTQWEERDGDWLVRLGMPTAAEAKAAFHLRLNVAAFIGHWGRNHCLFFTVTDEANLHPSQFARRWNSFLVRNGGWILSFIRVLEPQRKGRPHYHVLVAVSWDTRADAFDCEAFAECQQERIAHGYTVRFRELRARYKASAAPELVVLWSVLRKVLPRYGLGRAELLPIRKGKEAISEYIGKYLEGGLKLRRHSWKGCRRVEFDRRGKYAWLCCTRVFAWNSLGGRAWRRRVAQIAAALGVTNMDGIRRKLGPKWAYHLRESITLAAEVDWAVLLSTLASKTYAYPVPNAEGLTEQ